MLSPLDLDNVRLNKKKLRILTGGRSSPTPFPRTSSDYAYPTTTTSIAALRLADYL